MHKNKVKSSLKFFNDFIFAIKKSQRYADIENTDVEDEIKHYLDPKNITTLEHARLLTVVQTKRIGVLPRSLILHSRCECLKKGQKRFWEIINEGIECNDIVNKYNPWSFHFQNFDLKGVDLRRYYVSVIETMNKRHRLDYVSRCYLLIICKMVCQDSIMLERVELRFAWRPFENKIITFCMNASYFCYVRNKCLVCNGEYS